MDKKEEQFAIGYLRVADVSNELAIQQKISALRDYCEANQIRLVMVLTEPEKGSENFKGSGWKDMQKTLAHAEGRIQSIVVPDKNMLTNDVGLYLLKEKELRETVGVKIEVVEGKTMKTDQYKGMSLN